MKEENKVTDHHFTPISEYKYTLEFVEPRKTYEELQKENEALKLTFQVLKTATELFNNVKKLGETFQKGGIVNSDSEEPEMVYNEKKELAKNFVMTKKKDICPSCGSKNVAVCYNPFNESLCVDCDQHWEW